jgi:hypothetical protein
MAIGIRLSLMAFCLVFTVNIFGQARQITSGEFYASLQAAVDKGKDRPQRRTIQEDYLRGGKVHSTEIYVYEYETSDRFRYVHTSKDGNTVKKEELIQIGKDYFCRKNKGQWAKSKNWCAEMSISGLPDTVESGVTVEKTMLGEQEATLYQRQVIWKNVNSPNADKEGLSYLQTKFWLNSGGLLIRQESIMGLLEPKEVHSKNVSTYEYDVKIKIDAPVK